ncbi:MAG: ATP-binding protein [Methanoculleus sp.]|nr:ATP-binding protein [Methanoculleus sp.]
MRLYRGYGGDSAVGAARGVRGCSLRFHPAPGTLPPPLTLEKLRQAHGSVPANPLLAEPISLPGYIERMGTGTRDMIRHCTEAGLPEPEFAVRRSPSADRDVDS